ncbi:ATPase AAA [[Actinobacillus] muris]|uniref:ATPase AAA n=1 Tax=Muribacter muris TaxID=67855 RepID=A0A0J5P7S4_9PAST|nr:ATP-binding protein [Muribacter muris]KMK52261.1 ATPase AAA [[Actinobacillus] muris] [Muribacter muris]
MIRKSDLLATIENQQSRLVLQKSYPRKALKNLNLLPDFALIVSGIRRCGKSTLLAQLLSEQTLQVLFINFDTPTLFDFQFNDFQLLDEIIEEKQAKILFFDEIQAVENWEIYVRGKLDQGYQVVVTGSNASLLSRELGTKLTGRHITEELFPFSYIEFCEYLNKPFDASSVKDYLTQGGFPQYLTLQKNEILEMLINDILYRDIIVRYNIRNETAIKQLLLFLAGNVGNLISATKLKALINITSTATVQEYLSHLEKSYLIFLLPKFSYSYKSQLVNPRKIYFIDNGLQQVIKPSFTDDWGRKLENAVFWSLRQKTQELYYFNENNKECDFIFCQNNTPKQAIQVCLTLNAENNHREQEGLLDAMHYFNLDKGYIITLDQTDKILIGNKVIEVLPFYSDWLSYLE